ncbi:hypothetical protein ADK82_32210 [Streptomyces sp. NRRL S-4]|nr:hypothetical protein ADK82_32210 [Streptomyces sp. NRRL S-4]
MARYAACLGTPDAVTAGKTAASAGHGPRSRDDSSPLTREAMCWTLPRSLTVMNSSARTEPSRHTCTISPHATWTDIACS